MSMVFSLSLQKLHFFLVDLLFTALQYLDSYTPSFATIPLEIGRLTPDWRFQIGFPPFLSFPWISIRFDVPSHCQ